VLQDLPVSGFTALVVAACLVGFAKTALGGVGAVSVALFAAVLPARESTGALLPLLLVGDVVAVTLYRRHADWPTLLRLFPAVAAGVVLGAVFVGRVDDVVMRRTIGAVLLALVAVHVVQRRLRGSSAAPVAPPSPARRRGVAAVFGLLAGFTTMVANSGGPVMSLYLLTAGLGVLGFLGTAAWFFLLVNAFKVPFSVGLGLLTWDSLTLNATLVPAVLAGAAVGRALIRHLDQARFERLVLWVTAAASLNLLLR
jgi:uncharacterized protein